MESTGNWLDETVKKVNTNKKLYQFMCIILGKKAMTYREMFEFFRYINKTNNKNKETDTIIFRKVVELYKTNNGVYPYKVTQKTN